MGVDVARYRGEDGQWTRDFRYQPVRPSSGFDAVSEIAASLLFLLLVGGWLRIAPAMLLNAPTHQQLRRRNGIQKARRSRVESGVGGGGGKTSRGWWRGLSQGRVLR